MHSQFRKHAKLAAYETQRIYQVSISNAGSKRRISHFKSWARQPDLLQGRSPLAISIWSESGCAPLVLEKAVPLYRSALFLRAATRWLQEWEVGKEEVDNTGEH